MKEEMDLIAKTFQGLEDVLAEELENIGASDVKQGRRMVSFRGDKTLLYKANFCCRTALRILKPIYTFKACDSDELYEEAKKYDWEKLMSVDDTFAIDSVVNSESFRHSKFVTYRVKDAVADYFNEKYGKRPSIRLTNADILLNVHINNDEVTISLDSSGESLHKRGYRVAQTEAPINEVLAAGLILKTGWRGDSNFIDPMCGSGTFLIEAALIAANINPGVFRSSFAFERWRDYEPELMDAIYNDDSQEREFNFKIYGSDISPKAISIAEKNIKSAGVGKYIELQVLPIQRYEEAPERGILITNPPYGERISADDMDALYESIGEKLKKVFQGYHAWVLGYKSEYFDKIGLRPSVKIPVLNGALECEFREFVIFDGTIADFRKQGFSLKDKNERFQKTERPVSRWKSQGERFPRRENRDKDFRREERRERRPDKPFERDGKRFDRSRDRDSDHGGHKFDKERNDDRRRNFDRRDPQDRYERDRRGIRRERPKNALEEKYHKSYADRMRDEQQDDSVFEDEKVRNAVRFRKPRLFDENEFEQGETVMRHRNRQDKKE